MEELAGGTGTLAEPIPLNPPQEEALLMREQLMTKRAAAKAKKEGKRASKALAAVASPAVASALAAVEEAGQVPLAGPAVAAHMRRLGTVELGQSQKRSADASLVPEDKVSNVQARRWVWGVRMCAQVHACVCVHLCVRARVRLCVR